MSALLQPGTIVERGPNASYTIAAKISEGTQGEVYAVNDPRVAIKWYKPEYLPHDPLLRERLETAIERRSPTPDFLWPFALVTARGHDSFGYAMPFMEPRFRSFAEIMRRTVEPSARVLATVGLNLATNLLQLHVMRGLCYRDISLGNVFFDPDTAEVRIADNDNVDVEGRSGGLSGTLGFMPPEVVRGEAAPTRFSDLFALAVLLFMMFMINHPLKGKKEDELSLDQNDPAGWIRLTGLHPVFVFDPANDSNRPIPGVHEAALNFWPIYPAFLRRIFIRAFTDGLHDPDARISENEWKKTMVRLRDAVFPCQRCTAENHYDADVAGGANQPQLCWHCRERLVPPPCLHLRDNGAIVVLSGDTQLYPHHLADSRYDFSKPWAAVLHSPPALKNLSADTWTSRAEDGQLVPIPPGEAMPLHTTCKVNFGRVAGEIRV